MFHKLFPVYVFEHNYTDKILEEIQKEIQAEYVIQDSAGFIRVSKEENPRIGSLSTTSGAFDDVNNFINNNDKFPILKNEIFKNITLYCKQANIKIEIDPFIRRSWFAITNYGDTASLHTHLWEDLVVVYYYKTEGDEGNIQLHSPHKTIKYTRDNTYEIIPCVGKMIIFPGWLGHNVLVNNTDKERVSISVNIKIFNDYEYDRP